VTAPRVEGQLRVSNGLRIPVYAVVTPGNSAVAYAVGTVLKGPTMAFAASETHVLFHVDPFHRHLCQGAEVAPAALAELLARGGEVPFLWAPSGSQPSRLWRRRPFTDFETAVHVVHSIDWPEYIYF
jgi:hypothetical protein